MLKSKGGVFSFANGQEDVSTSVLPVPYLPWKVIFYIRVLNAPGPVLLGADEHEVLGLVVDHVHCSVFLSHLKLEDTVEGLPSRHLALSLHTEDVNVQYEALTPETRERLNNVLFQKEVDPDTNVSMARAHGYLKICRNPLLCVYRDVPVKDETAHESEIDLSVEPHTTDEHAGISSTRRRRRLTHKSPVSARFSDDFEEDDVMQVQAAAFAENLEMLLERLALLVLKAIYFLLPWGRIVNLVRPSLEDTDTLSSSSRREMTPPNCPLCSKPMIRRQDRVNKESFLCCQQVAEVQRNSSTLGKGQRRNLLQHDKSALVDPCCSSTSGFLLH